MKNNKTFGIALGGGAAKAICEFGMLRQIVNRGIKIDYITGASCGAIMGALYALGLTTQDIEQNFYKYFGKGRLDSLLNLNFLHGSFYKNDYIVKILREVFGEKTFDDCKIPFACTAVDLETGEEVILKKGKIWEALMASASLPGVFEPFHIDGRLYIDGGLVEDVPMVTMRKAFNPDIMLGMKISDSSNRQLISALVFKRYQQKKYKKIIKGNIIKRIFNSVDLEKKLFLMVIDQTISILRSKLYQQKIDEARPDLILKLDMEEYGLLDFKQSEKIVIRGEQLMMAHMPELESLLDGKNMTLNSLSTNDNLTTVKTPKKPKK